ncbi:MULTISPECIES: hypothetical protein [unclassified Microcoleus]|uniref:hypothetical protein n=1 Tax=unclassified Microcoleus TaxID=2642155 RepID=UPI002FCF6B0A
MITLKYLVLGPTYFGFGWGYLPGRRMNRAAVAIIGSAFVVALGILDLKTAWEAIDLSTMFCVGNDDREYS